MIVVLSGDCLDKVEELRVQFELLLTQKNVAHFSSKLNELSKQAAFTLETYLNLQVDYEDRSGSLEKTINKWFWGNDSLIESVIASTVKRVKSSTFFDKNALHLVILDGIFRANALATLPNDSLIVCLSTEGSSYPTEDIRYDILEDADKTPMKEVAEKILNSIQLGKKNEDT